MPVIIYNIIQSFVVVGQKSGRRSERGKVVQARARARYRARLQGAATGQSCVLCQNQTELTCRQDSAWRVVPRLTLKEKIARMREIRAVS